MIKAKLGERLDAGIRTALPFLFRGRLSPNALSVAGVLVSLAAAAAFAAGAFVAGGLLALAGGLFDLVDGAVARHQGRATAFGAFLDSTLDRVVDMLLLLGILLHYAAAGARGVALLAAGALLATVLVSYTKARAESVVPDFGGGLFERGERIVVLVLGALTGFLPLALGVVAAGSAVTVGQRVHRAHRAMERLEAAAAGPGETGRDGFDAPQAAGAAEAVRKSSGGTA